MVDIAGIKRKKTTAELLQFSIINVDKPIGPTSFDVVEQVKKILGINKTSHFGTLDPAVSGVLPVALNRACRLSGYFIKKDKTYIGIIRLHQDIDNGILKEEMQKFVGKIMQKPPVKSRVKRVERPRSVYTFEILEISGKDVLFSTKVEAGTYIRKLISDLGEKIGGAHMLELRRISAGIFDERDSCTLYEINEAFEEYKKGNDKKLRQMLIPGEIIAKIMPVGYVKKEVINKLFRGSPVFYELLEKIPLEKIGSIALFHKDRLIEIARIVNEKNVYAVPEFVLN
ncbi:RNA-guided pseudouridylation complex pseudouridine synthase subunit Cbf5 [Candidatus Pacearchaeota archaeon]|nr:RNA-guided pseudouridylation complex pseudouridine synthase subunit Cbf5 [Candidatus Pacearchaeota archaeon]